MDKGSFVPWLILLTLPPTGLLFSQPVLLRGNAPDYAGCELAFYTFADRITHTREELGACRVADNGDFQLTLTPGKTIQVFADLGIYSTYLYIEPGNEYEVILPPRKDKSRADKMNPYFRMQEIHLGILNYHPSELNYLIRNFDDTFYPFFQKYSIQAYLQTAFTSLDSALHQLTIFRDYSTNTFFQVYVQYKIALLQHMAMKDKSRSIRFSENNPGTFPHNPGYMEWFSQVFRNYFEYLAGKTGSSSIHRVIDREKSLSGLVKLLSEEGTLTGDTAIEFAILKGLYDEYYSDQFHKPSLLAILDSVSLRTRIPEHKRTADNIIDRITRLMTGSVAPGFTLLSLDNDSLSTKDLKGKYIYLNFCSSFSYSCIIQLEQLKLLGERYRDVLEIVTISVDDDPQQMSRMKTTKGYSWIFLDMGDNAKILQAYDVRVYPTYYLIDPEGRLAMSPAPGPEENFEEYFVEMLRSGKKQ